MAEIEEVVETPVVKEEVNTSFIDVFIVSFNAISFFFVLILNTV